jgi:hypothetical protein
MITVATNAQSYSGTETLVVTGSITPAPGTGTTVSLLITNPDGITVVFNDNITVTAKGGFSYAVNIVANSTGWEYGIYTVTITSEEPIPMIITAQFFYTPFSVTTTSTATSSASTVTTVTATVTSTKTALLTSTQTQTLTTTATTTQPATTVTGTVTSTKTLPPITSTATTTGPPTTVTSTAPPTTVTSTQTSTATAPPTTVTSTLTQTTSTTPGWAYGVMVVLLLIGLAIGYVVKRPSVKQK